MLTIVKYMEAKLITAWFRQAAISILFLLLHPQQA